MKIGYIGLGIMGRPLAKHLLKAGFDLMVSDVNPVPVEELVGMGAGTGTYAEIQRAFLDSGWTDGLPVAPPTEDAVAEFLVSALPLVEQDKHVIDTVLKVNLYGALWTARAIRSPSSRLPPRSPRCSVRTFTTT